MQTPSQRQRSCRAWLHSPDLVGILARSTPATPTSRRPKPPSYSSLCTSRNGGAAGMALPARYSCSAHSVVLRWRAIPSINARSVVLKWWAILGINCGGLGFGSHAALLAGLQTDRADFHQKLRLLKTSFHYFFIYKCPDLWKNKDMWRVMALQSSSAAKCSPQTHLPTHEHNAAVWGPCCEAASTPHSRERGCLESFSGLELFTSPRQPHGGYAQD